MSVRPNSQSRAARLWWGIAALAWAIGVVIWATTGVQVRVAGVLLRARSPWPAIAVAVAAAAAAVWRGRRRVVADQNGETWQTRRIHTVAAVAVSLLAGTAGLVWGTWAASGADASGYVSQALMWSAGQNVLAVPFTTAAPWPDPAWVMSPLGWRPGLVPATIVPTYAPGLPLMMAVGACLAGDSAVYVVVPVTGALVVWWTWQFGLLAVGRRAAWMTTALMTTSPAFLFQIVQPMSDVPVTAWWIGALLYAVRRRALVAGVLSGAAVVTRPNLLPLALWIGFVLVISVRRHEAGQSPHTAHRERWPRAASQTAWFVAGLLPAIGVWILLNQHWYGHAVASGYGASSDLFARRNILPNVMAYSRWLTEAHTPLIWLAVPGSLAAIWAAVGSRQWSPLLSAAGMAALVIAAYLPYAVFAEWTYLRFLLPALPLVLMLVSHAVCRVVARFDPAVAMVILVGGTIGLAGWQVRYARSGHAFDLCQLERRYPEVGRLAAAQLPAQAVLLAVQQSGSLAVYTHRPVLRWDHIPANTLEHGLAWLRAQGYVPYFVVEQWEEGPFRERFSGSTSLGQLDWPPTIVYDGTVDVRIYDPAARARFVAGADVPTRRFHQGWTR